MGSEKAKSRRSKRHTKARKEDVNGNQSDSKKKAKRKGHINASVGKPLGSKSFSGAGAIGIKVLLRFLLLCVVFGSMVLIDVSFLHVEDLNKKQSIGTKILQHRAKQRLETLSAAASLRSSTDIVADAISDLDSLLSKTKKNRFSKTEKLSANVVDRSVLGRREIEDDSQTLDEEGLEGRLTERILKCRKKNMHSNDIDEDLDFDDEADDTSDNEAEELTMTNGDDEIEDGGFAYQKTGVDGCGPDEEEYYIEVVKDIEPDEEDFNLAEDLGIERTRFAEILRDASDHIDERRGRLGGLNLKSDGFDVSGISSELLMNGFAFSDLLEEDTKKRGKGKKGKKTALRRESRGELAGLSRENAIEIRPPSDEFKKFVKELRSSGKPYNHVSKKSDFDRGLKELGYKAAPKAKTPSLWQGYEGVPCPSLKKASMQIYLCNQYLPDFKEYEQFQLMRLFNMQNPNIPVGAITDFFPETWRLYKIEERRALKARCGNNSLAYEGGPYVTKYTVAGTAGLTLTMWDRIKHSDRSTQLQIKEAKNKVIVQRYINNPYLFNYRKFIIRTYVVIVSNRPMIVYYHEGALFRSISKFSPFTKRDGNYHRAAHFTNDQKSHKGLLKSSSLYSSLDLFEEWLYAKADDEDKEMLKHVRSKLKALVIYALYALMRPKIKTYANNAAMPNDVAVVQQACFDFLLDKNKHIWYLGSNTGSHCFLNMGGSSYRPPWKEKLKKDITDRSLKLAEEILWRKSTNKPISTMSFFSQMEMDVLIDETFPDWNYVQEINDHLAGKRVGQDRSPPEEGEHDEHEDEEGDEGDEADAEGDDGDNSIGDEGA